MKTFFKTIIVWIITFLAKGVLRKYEPTVVAVTGNVGKTSTKDAIYAVLSHAYYVRKSEKSFNSEIGVPLTILGCANPWFNPIKWFFVFKEGLGLIFLKNHYPKWLILEVGADRPGDIQNIARWLRPDIVVGTAMAETPVHIEFFSSPEELLEEKRSLVRALRTGGTLILNEDDTRIRTFRDVAPDAKIFTYGQSEKATIRGSHISLVSDKHGNPEGIRFRIDYASKSIPAHIEGTIGLHHVYTVLAAVAVGVSRDINIISAVEWAQAVLIPPGRLRIIPGIKESTILDDSYNASPKAVLSALESLEEVESVGRKIVVLGDMLELGKYSADEHKKIGKRAGAAADVLVTVGKRAEDISMAGQKGVKKANTHHFENVRKAGEFLASFVKKGDVVLVKGSQGMRMERICEALLANPNDKVLLPRQDPEWLARE